MNRDIFFAYKDRLDSHDLDDLRRTVCRISGWLWLSPCGELDRFLTFTSTCQIHNRRMQTWIWSDAHTDIFIYRLYLIILAGLQDCLCISPVVIGREAGHTLDRSPVYQRTQQHRTKNLEIHYRETNNTMVLFINYWRKVEYLDRTHECTENMKTQRRRFWKLGLLAASQQHYQRHNKLAQENVKKWEYAFYGACLSD